MTEDLRVGEVIEAATTGYTAQCYELYTVPPLGSLVRTREGDTDLLGIVYQAVTASFETGRRPIARGRDEATPEAVYAANPQLMKLLRSEFSVLVVGHRADGALRHYLPPAPARIHGFVYKCPADEVREFSNTFGFLNILVATPLPVAQDEVIAAALRSMSGAHEDGRGFLVKAGKELAGLLSHDFSRLKYIFGRLN